MPVSVISQYFHSCLVLEVMNFRWNVLTLGYVSTNSRCSGISLLFQQGTQQWLVQLSQTGGHWRGSMKVALAKFGGYFIALTLFFWRVMTWAWGIFPFLQREGKSTVYQIWPVRCPTGRRYTWPLWDNQQDREAQNLRKMGGTEKMDVSQHCCLCCC